MEDVLKIIIALVSGGFLQYITQYFIAKRKANYDEMQIIVDTWSEDNARLRKVEKLYREKIDSMEKEIAVLRAQILVIESVHQQVPLPMWLKDSRGTMLSLNKAYEVTFLNPRGFTVSDYLGNTDFSIWPENTANDFIKHDEQVLENNETLYVFENVPGEKGSDKYWMIVKYPRYSSDKNLVGVGGIAVPLDQYKSQIKDIVCN